VFQRLGGDASIIRAAIGVSVLAGYSMTFRSPFSQINQAAALGAERAGRALLSPLNWLAACWAFNNQCFGVLLGRLGCFRGHIDEFSIEPDS